jgi:hypothetical protein
MFMATLSQLFLEARKNPDVNTKEVLQQRLDAALTLAKQSYNPTYVMVYCSDDNKFHISPNMKKQGILVHRTGANTKILISYIQQTNKKYAHILGIPGSIIDIKNASTQSIQRLVAAGDKLDYDTYEITNMHETDMPLDDIMHDIVSNRFGTDDSNGFIASKYVEWYKTAGIDKVAMEGFDSVLVVDTSRITHISTVQATATVRSMHYNNLQKDLPTALVGLSSLVTNVRKLDNKTATELVSHRVTQLLKTFKDDIDSEAVGEVVAKTFDMLHVRYGDAIWTAWEPFIIKHPTGSVYDYAIKLNKRFPKTLEPKLVSTNPTTNTSFIQMRYKKHFGLK